MAEEKVGQQSAEEGGVDEGAPVEAARPDATPAQSAEGEGEARPAQPEVSGAPTEPACSTDSAAPDPTPQPRKKLGKAAIGAIAAAAVVVAAVGGFFAWNISLDNALKAQAELDLAASGVVEEETIQSAWGDQRGFAVSEVEAASAHREGDSAMVLAHATADNGSYRAVFDYKVPYSQQDGQWVMGDIEQFSIDYVPIGKISDDALVANFGAILAEADKRADAMIYQSPQTLAGFFGAGNATVLSNKFADGVDEAVLELSAEHDGVPCSGQLNLTFCWDEAADGGPDWQIYLAYATADTYGAMGSVPHEGLYTYATDADREEANSKASSWDTFWVCHFTEIFFAPGESYGLFAFENVPGNNVDLACTMTLNDTGEVLYESPRLHPNSCIDSIRLNRSLEPGTYTATVVTRAYDRASGAFVGDSTMGDFLITVQD